MSLVTVFNFTYLRLFVEQTDSFPLGVVVDPVSREFAIAVGPVAIILEVGRE